VPALADGADTILALFGGGVGFFGLSTVEDSPQPLKQNREQASIDIRIRRIFK
jgi:hypothetical protein